MTAVAWPFLVSRTHTAGHRVVVAPDFTVDEDTASALGRVAEGPNTPDGEAIVHRSTDGEFAIVSRVFVADCTAYGIDGEGLLRDRSGRVIRFTEGVVTRAMGTTVTQADLDRAHTAVAEPYRRFWETGESYRTVSSTAFPIGTSPGTPLRLRPAPHDNAVALRRATGGTGARRTPSQRTGGLSRRTTRVLVGLIAVAVVAGGAAFMSYPFGEQPQPTVSAPNRCTTPKTFCLVLPTALDAGSVTVEPDGAGTSAPDGTCVNDRGGGLLVTGSQQRRVTLDWIPTRRHHLDLSRRGRIDFALRPDSSLDTIEVAVTDVTGARQRRQLTLTDKAGDTQRATLELADLTDVDLTAVTILTLTWSQPDGDETDTCVTEVAFRGQRTELSR